MDLIYDCKNPVGPDKLCEKRSKVRNFEGVTSMVCAKCGDKKEIFVSEGLKKEKMLDVCPVCQKTDFYTQRDFPQAAGCLIVLVGACFVPWTYGLSLAVVAVIDFILFKILRDIAVCYHCLSRVRGTKPNPKHKPFDHNIFEFFIKQEQEEKQALLEPQ